MNMISNCKSLCVYACGDSVCMHVRTCLNKEHEVVNSSTNKLSLLVLI